LRYQFVLSEIFIGLRRNLTMTIALVVSMAVSLVLVGSSLLVNAQVKEMKGYWYDKVEVTVWLCGTTSTSPNCASTAVTQAQRDQLQQDLAETPQVQKVYYESQSEAYERFKDQFKDSPDLVANVSPDALPESFRVKLKDPEQFEVVSSAFTDRPGVDSVQDLKKALEPLFKVLRGFQLMALFAAIGALLAAVLLVSNMVRVAAFSRRRETGIMRLVGASNLYIQLPFLLEGVLAGLVGAVLAGFFLALLKYFFIDKLLRPTIKFTNFIGWGAVLGAVPWLILLGVTLSAVASLLTLRRHLRV
jgi:cell division transport system permease protein